MPLHPHLVELLKGHPDGLPMERFMQEALYHPDHGYYTAQAATLGPGGDFSTSATLHPLLGRAMARWLVAQKKRWQLSGTWHVLELGGGNGALAKSILAELGWWNRRQLHYQILETSPRFRQIQQQLLKGCNVHWPASIQHALTRTGGTVLIISNEFVDAFACQVLQKAADQWRPVGLRVEAGHWKETLGPPIGHFGLTWDDPLWTGASRIEIQDSYRRWLHSWSGQWRRGAMLTLDYGDRLPDLYHRRPHGTFRAYYRHERLTGFAALQRFGQQDLTADVNFSLLEIWGQELGWQANPLRTQREFLLKYCPEAESVARHSPEIAYLIDEQGAGSAFKVLEQHISL